MLRRFAGRLRGWDVRYVRVAAGDTRTEPASALCSVAHGSTSVLLFATNADTTYALRPRVTAVATYCGDRQSDALSAPGNGGGGRMRRPARAKTA